MITAFSFTEPGDRTRNEDAVATATRENVACFVLCDGLGGHSGGAEASRLACDTVTAAFLASGEPSLSLRMDVAILAAQDAVSQMAPPRGKTTLCCLMLDESRVSAVWVGDSRIYLFRNGAVVGHTLDHSVPQHLVRMGKITDRDIRHHEDRNRLLRALGDDWDNPEYEHWSLPEAALPGDAFLLCSDGFWEWVEDEEMLSCLLSADGPETWAMRMQDAALKKGCGHSMDNYSAITVWVQ